MRATSVVMATLLTAGCATAGFPVQMDPSGSLSGATQAVNAAAAAGADSLAAEAMTTARQHLTAAQAEFDKGHLDRAGVFAREAQADAAYARAVVGRAQAERARREAQAALTALPPQED